jgi:hypothetical protein
MRLTGGEAMSNTQKHFFSATLTLLLIVAALWPAFDSPILQMDEGTLLLYPELILRGKLPYRDFETFYGPGNLWFLAGAYSLFGIDVFVARSVGLLYHLAIYLGIFMVLRRANTTLAIAGTLIAAVVLRVVQLAPFAWLAGVACALWALIALAELPAKWRAITGGLLAGGALLCRPDLGPAVLLSTLPLVLFLPPRERWSCVGAFAFSMLPFAWLTFAAGWMETLSNVFIYPVLVCNSARRLPLGAAPNFVASLVWLHFGAVACNLLAGILATRENSKSHQARLQLCAALLSLGLTHQAMQRVEPIHVAFTVFLSIALLPMSVAVLIGKARELGVKPHLAWVSISAVVALLVGIAAEPTHFFLKKVVPCALNSTSVFVGSTDRKLPLGSLIEARYLQKIISALEKRSSPGERVFIGPGDLRRTSVNDTYIYHLLPWLTPASYFLELNPLSANRPNSRLADDVATADWLILNRMWDAWSEPNDSMRLGSNAPNEVVQTLFELRGRIGLFELYQHKKPLTSALR